MQSQRTLRRIAAIHDLSCVGKCSLTVALPVISATGVECSCIPTAVLSTHTGEFTGYVIEPLGHTMVPVARHWKQEGVQIDGVYTGYLASPEQVEQVEQVLDLLAGPQTLVIVDPVMADNGSYYAGMGEPMCQAFRHLCRRATIITPNITEAALLAGLPYPQGALTQSSIAPILEALAQLGPRYVAVTGVRSEAGVGNLLLDTETGRQTLALRPRLDGLFYGTGDLFASSLSGLLVRGMEPEKALTVATDLVAASIALTAQSSTPRRFGVEFERALPDYIRRIDAEFSEVNV